MTPEKCAPPWTGGFHAAWRRELRDQGAVTPQGVTPPPLRGQHGTRVVRKECHFPIIRINLELDLGQIPPKRPWKEHEEEVAEFC